VQSLFLITNIKPEKQACCKVDAGYTPPVAVIHLYRLSKTRVRAGKQEQLSCVIILISGIAWLVEVVEMRRMRRVLIDVDKDKESR
jgi:hypothetical protein